MFRQSFGQPSEGDDISASFNIALLTANPANYSNRRMMEAGRELGYNVYPLRTLHQRLDVDNAAYIANLDPCPDAVIPRISPALSGFGLCLITSFEQAGIFTPVPSLGLLRSRDKFLAGQLLASSGIAVPKTVTFTDYDDIDMAIKAIGGYPFVIKRLKGTQGNAVHLIKRRKKAYKRLGKYINKHRPFLIQEYIAESHGQDLRCFVVGGKVIAAMRRIAAKGDFRANIHAGGHGEAISLSDNETDIALRAANVMGLDVAGVDILQTHRGPIVLEVNSSPGLQGIEHATGVDIAREIIQFIAVKIRN